MVKGINWTDKEDKVIQEMYAEHSVEDIKKKLPNRTVDAIKQRAYVLGLTGPIGRPKIYDERKPYSFMLPESKMKKLVKKLGVKTIQKAVETCIDSVLNKDK